MSWGTHENVKFNHRAPHVCPMMEQGCTLFSLAATVGLYMCCHAGGFPRCSTCGFFLKNVHFGPFALLVFPKAKRAKLTWCVRQEPLPYTVPVWIISIQVTSGAWKQTMSTSAQGVFALVFALVIFRPFRIVVLEIPKRPASRSAT